MDRLIRNRLLGARHIVVFTGAGVSAESGLRTFRDPQQGLWSTFNPQELATPQAFARDPALVWGWYEWRRAAVAAARPNPGHHAIATMARHVPKLTVVTQNVDNLHERAGSAPVLHLHGQISRPYCEICHKPHEVAEPDKDMPADGARLEPPSCAGCGARVRPGVVWFGEALPQGPWQAALAATADCDALLCCGTSSLVYPAAALPEVAIRRGVVTVQINPNPTPLDGHVSLVLRASAGVALPQLLREIWGQA